MPFRNNMNMGNGYYPSQQMPMNNPINFLNKFAEFKRNFQGNPQQMVMNLLNSGQMSQSQFNQLQQIANQIMRNT